MGLAGLLALTSVAYGKEPGSEAVYQRGVALGRAGHYHRAFALLLPLLQQEPGNYPLRRDVVVLFSWQGNCRAALRYYRPIAHRADPEDYLVAAVGECLLKNRRRRAARALLVPALQRYPSNTDIRQLLRNANERLASQGNPTVDLSLQSDSSDKGNIEWRARASAQQALTDRWTLIARALAARAQDPAFATGDLNRLGLGLRFDVGGSLTLGGEYSADVVRAGEGGFSWSLEGSPSDRWHFALGQTGFAEDVPLRAQAINVRARSSHASADVHSDDWRWEGSVNTSRSAFSDGNTRTSVGASIDYATVLKPRHERRLLLEIWHSSNTLPAAGVVYFNPASDFSLIGGYRFTWLVKTRYQRLARHIDLRGGLYAQQGYDTLPVASVRFAQELQFNSRSSLAFHVVLGSNVYDGGRETDATGGIEYIRKF
jgi:tetratricopeptide (TPR) repeat protein